MKYFIIFLYIVVVLFLQIGILPNLKILNTCPNLFLLSVIALTVLIGWKNILGWAIISGLFLDFYSLHGVLGISVISMALSCFLAYFLNRKYFKKESKLSLIFIFVVSIIFYELLLLLLFRIFAIGYSFSPLELIVKIIYSVVLALPVYYIAKWYVDKIK